MANDQMWLDSAMILDVPTPHDHCHILILVKLHGYRNSDRCSLVLNRIYDRIKRVNVVTVSDNPQRTVSVKYVNYYSPKWNQWGEFQAHRRLLGLLYVATLDSNTSLTVTPTSRKASFDPVSDPNSPEDVGLLDVSKSRSRSCVTQLNFEQSNGSGSGFDSQLNSSTSNDCLTGANSQHAVIEQFRTSIDEFKATLYDSRCFIFGSETFVASDSNCHNGITENTTLHNGDRPTCLNVNDNRVKEKNVLYYSSLEDCKTDFESQVKVRAEGFIKVIAIELSHSRNSLTICIGFSRVNDWTDHLKSKRTHFTVRWRPGKRNVESDSTVAIQSEIKNISFTWSPY